MLVRNNLATFDIKLDSSEAVTVNEALYEATQDVIELVNLIRSQNDKVSTMQAIVMLQTAVHLMEVRK